MRKYSNASFETDLAAIIHGTDNVEFEGMSRCPCCGSVTSSGDHAQVMYYSLIDDMFKLLTEENGFNKNKATTKLITRLNEMVNTSISCGDGEAKDSQTAKVNRINLMISKLVEVRV